MIQPSQQTPGVGGTTQKAENRRSAVVPPLSLVNGGGGGREVQIRRSGLPTPHPRPSWDAPTQELQVLQGFAPATAPVRYLEAVVLPEAKPVRKAWRPDLWPFRTWGPLLCLPALFCTLVLIVAVHALSTLAGAMTWTL